MFESLLSAAGGGLFGLVGAGFTKIVGYFEQKQQLAHAIQMAAEDRLNMEMEITLAQAKGVIDLELQESEQDAKNLQTAINAEASITGTSQWVADMRGSLRPILTYSLVACAVAMSVWAAKDNPFTNEIIFLATTATTFWFGSRPPSRK